MKSYKYYAFISYARKDSTPFAKYVQRELEHYRYPMAGIEEFRKPNDNQFLRKIFLDLNELENSEKTFHEELLTKIENTKYLIVLCSLESAKSKWVDSEIQHFLKTHDNNYNLIIPVLCNGKVPENIPPTLNRDDILSRNLPSFVQFEGDDKNEAKERGLSQLIAYLLGVERDKVSNRFQMEKRKQQLKLIKTFAILLLMFLGLTCWALFERNKAEIALQKETIALQKEKIALSNERLAKENETKMRIVAEENEKIAKHNEQIAIKKRKEQQDTLEFYSNIFSSEMIENDNISLKDFLKSHIQDTDLLDNDYVKVQLKLNMAEILTNTRMFDEAKKLLDETYKLIQKLPSNLKQYKLADYYNKYGTLQYYSNMTNKNRTKAIEYYNKALSLKFDSEDKPVEVYLNMINIYMLDENYSAAGNTLEKLYKCINSLSDKDLRITEIPIYYYTWRNICIKQHDYQKALKYNQEYINAVAQFTKYDTFHGYAKQKYENTLTEAYMYNAKLKFLLKNYSESYKLAKSLREKTTDDDIINLTLDYIIIASDFKLNHKLAKQKDYLTRVSNLYSSKLEQLKNDKNKTQDLKDAYIIKIYNIINNNLLFVQNEPFDDNLFNLNMFDALILSQEYLQAVVQAHLIFNNNEIKNPLLKLKILTEAEECCTKLLKTANVKERKYAEESLIIFLNSFNETFDTIYKRFDAMPTSVEKIILYYYLMDLSSRIQKTIKENKDFFTK